MARRSDHSREEIRDMALDAAEQIVLEEGPDGLSARKVANKIGYTVGTLYLVFKNLDDLVMHINARTLDRLHQQLTKDDIQHLAPTDRILHFGQIYIHFAYSDPHLWALIYQLRAADNPVSPDWYREKIMHAFAVVEEALRPLAPNRPKCDISQAAHALWAGIHGICILGITQKLEITGEISVKQLANSLIVNYLNGFTSEQHSS